MLQLLYVESGWEKDYTIKYLLQNIRFENYYVIKYYQLSDRFIQDLLKQSDEFILVFSSNNLGYKAAENLVKTLKPKLIIHNSDEHGTRPEMLNLSKYTSLMLTQYMFHHNTVSHNVLNVPVAYLPGFHVRGVPNWEDIKPMNKREYDWSFVGELKSDRAYAIDTFKTIWNDARYYCGKTSRDKMNDVYNNTRFVISPRGYKNMLCSRTFEAITSGAIPIIAGCTRDEMEKTYNYFGLDVPFLHADTWEEAVQLCKRTENLDDIQSQCIVWFKSITIRLQKAIHEALHLPNTYSP